MIVSHVQEAEKKKINHPEAREASMKALISPEEGWEGHVMRVVELKPGGHTPRHIHPWPHINFMVHGHGTLFLEGKKHAVKEGSYAYVPAGKEHQFINEGSEPFEFICIVPEEGHQ